jgi:hypothetical protein
VRFAQNMNHQALVALTCPEFTKSVLPARCGAQGQLTRQRDAGVTVKVRAFLTATRR